MIIISALYVVPQLAYSRDEKLKWPYHLRFAEDGIEFRTDNLDSRLGWLLYTNVLIDHHSYLLYQGNAQFTIIPKHALPDDVGSSSSFWRRRSGPSFGGTDVVCDRRTSGGEKSGLLPGKSTA